MKNSFRILLLVLGIIALLREVFLGIPGLGGTYILSLGWAPLGTSILLFGIMAIIMFADRYGRSKELLWVPVMGIVFSLLAFIPVIGMLLHWIMTFVLVYFIIRLMSMPAQYGNTRVYYGGDTDKTVNRR
ncbi:hypothetical protein ERX37_06455 [Macrococcus hajekii]|uniref:Uncharacterized protein n=1 Tax=Macrococcus hajekii TaxID=198482 RepID=A0A4R6BJL1_9STAP|nr:hypothetical protein [Macrococcus hajekii]TDM01847.1 hypothetical protein ERX37_06455 [Macrococcus hajekii]GGB07950.1 hypothetical protein GCM10007190_14920 [Macrococcus hajekii]